MKSIKLSIVAALLATTSVVSNVSANELEVSANVALTSNYIWRGMTQTANSPAVQGGVDLGYKGAYIGVWGSSIDFGNGSAGGSTASSEFDIYVGYASEISGLSYDIGLIQFMYPGDTENLNFAEAYLSLGYDFKVASVSAMYALGIDADAPGVDNFGDAWEVGVSVPLPADVTLDGTYGEYEDDTSTTAYGDYYSVSLSKSFGKFDYSIAYVDFDSNAGSASDDDNIVFTVGTSF